MRQVSSSFFFSSLTHLVMIDSKEDVFVSCSIWVEDSRILRILWFIVSSCVFCVIVARFLAERGVSGGYEGFPLLRETPPFESFYSPPFHRPLSGLRAPLSMRHLLFWPITFHLEHSLLYRILLVHSWIIFHCLYQY